MAYGTKHRRADSLVQRLVGLGKSHNLCFLRGEGEGGGQIAGEGRGASGRHFFWRLAWRMQAVFALRRAVDGRTRPRRNTWGRSREGKGAGV